MISGDGIGSISIVSLDVPRPQSNQAGTWWSVCKVPEVMTVDLTSDGTTATDTKKRRKRRLSREINRLQCETRQQKRESGARYKVALKEDSSQWHASCL